MILQSLNDYYLRKAADPESGIAPEGFEHKEIPFVIVIDSEGKLVQIEDTRRPVGKQIRSKSFLIPQSEKRASGIKANLLWDNAEYVFGVSTKGKPERVIEQHKAFIQRIEDLKVNDDGVKAILKFLQADPIAALDSSEYASEIKEINPFLVFRLNDESNLISGRRAIVAAINETSSDAEAGICLITGESDSLANLQPAIKGVRGANTTGGNIVSFNLPAFNSFGKAQGANAPISEKAAFAYTTALNHLLGKDSTQKLQIGDTTTVFWSDKKSHFENEFSLFLDEPRDDPDALTNAVAALLRSVDTGVMPVEDSQTRFFVLGLAPNAARISVRFWQVGTVEQISKRLASYFHDLEIVANFNSIKSHFPLREYLRAAAPLGDLDRLPPNMSADVMRAILAGLPFPESLLHAVVRKIRLPRDEKKFSTRVGYEIAVQYPCTALLKAYLNRKTKFQSQDEKEITVSLDKENLNSGYRLGRLFAVLEKIQEEAQPNINATIRDRYYSAASGTPASVMPILMRTKNHHLAKLAEKKRQVYFERLLGEILGEVNDLPNQLSLQDQGRFAIGYYHQRQDFFTKRETSNTDQGETV